jgi:hypothetical protein
VAILMPPLVVLDAGRWSARCACGWLSASCPTGAAAGAEADAHRCDPAPAVTARRRACLAPRRPLAWSTRESTLPLLLIRSVVEVLVMLVLAVGLGLVLAWLIQQFVQGWPPTRERAMALLVGVAVIGIALGVVLSKAPLAGPAIDHGTEKFAGTVGVAYDPANAIGTSRGVCPTQATRPAGQPPAKG